MGCKSEIQGSGLCVTKYDIQRWQPSAGVGGGTNPIHDCLLGRGDFVGDCEEPTAPGKGDGKEIEWPHMASDHGLLCRGDGEIPEGVVGGNAGMVVAVETIAPLMPVIEIVVVKDGSADQRVVIGLQMENVVEPVGGARHPQDMVIGRGGSVLDVLAHAANPDIFCQVS